MAVLRAYDEDIAGLEALFHMLVPRRFADSYKMSAPFQSIIEASQAIPEAEIARARQAAEFTPVPRLRHPPYLPLRNDSKEIRVLSFSSKASLHAGPCLEISILDIQDPYRPEYEALSYTWGAVGPTKEVMLHGEAIPIRETLWNFLCRLSAHYMAKDAKTLFWLDALCINQNDDLERNAQVSMMGDIYSSATTVVSWLGEDSDAIMTLKSTLARASDIGDPMFTQAYWASEILQGCVQLFSHPYWTRIWILQELALAKEVVLMCGRHTFKPSDIRSILNACDLTAFSDLRASIGHKYFNDVNALRTNQLQGQALPDLILNFYNSGCQDKRDKIFALLSLCNAADRRAILPDYRHSVYDVFISVSRHIMSSSVQAEDGHGRLHPAIWVLWQAMEIGPSTEIETRLDELGLGQSVEECKPYGVVESMWPANEYIETVNQRIDAGFPEHSKNKGQTSSDFDCLSLLNIRAHDGEETIWMAKQGGQTSIQLGDQLLMLQNYPYYERQALRIGHSAFSVVIRPGDSSGGQRIVGRCKHYSLGNWVRVNPARDIRQYLGTIWSGADFKLPDDCSQKGVILNASALWEFWQDPWLVAPDYSRKKNPIALEL